MKVFKTLLVSLSILFISVFVPAQLPGQGSSEFRPGSEPDGFRGIKWGAEISELKDMALVMAIDKDVKRYARKTDILKIGEGKLDYIQYEFWKGRFCLVDMEFQGTENWNNVRKAVFAMFGKRQNMSEKGEELPATYRWEGEKTTVLMIYDSNLGGGVTISSNEVMDQKGRVEEE
jgi:hypothetical protein